MLWRPSCLCGFNARQLMLSLAHSKTTYMARGLSRRAAAPALSSAHEYLHTLGRPDGDCSLCSLHRSSGSKFTGKLTIAWHIDLSPLLPLLVKPSSSYGKTIDGIFAENRSRYDPSHKLDSYPTAATLLELNENYSSILTSSNFAKWTSPAVQSHHAVNEQLATRSHPQPACCY